MKVNIVEVGPRDGLQNESHVLDVKERSMLVEMLLKCGLRKIEVGAFVSAQKVPQMARTDEVVSNLSSSIKNIKSHISVLVPNLDGMEAAVRVGITEVAVFTAASETFTRKNINCSIEESFHRFVPVIELAKRSRVKVRGYISTCFGCPYEGDVDPKTVVRIADRLQKLGVYEISVGDTIGVANPKQVVAMLKLLLQKVSRTRLAMHFHDTRGLALTNIYASLTHGIRTFDCSVGGLGGCPYAPGASGNVATEDVVNLLNGLGVQTGVSLPELLKVNAWLSQRLKRKLPSRMGAAGLNAKIPPVFGLDYGSPSNKND